MVGSLTTCLCRNLGSKLEWQDYQWFASVGSDNENVPPMEPAIQLAKALGSDLNFDNAVHIQNRHGEVAEIGTPDRTAQWNTLGCKSPILKEFDNRSFGAITLVS
jgi:hypothetical protein